MDVVQDWASYLFYANPSFLPYVNTLYTYTMLATNTIRSYLLPLISRASSSPDLATVALLLIILFVSLKILNMLWNAMLFWLRLAYRIAFWAGLAFLALWAYNRGPEGMVEDWGYWVGVWQQEHRYWKEQESGAARMARGRSGYAAGQAPVGNGGGGVRWY